MTPGEVGTGGHGRQLGGATAARRAALTYKVQTISCFEELRIHRATVELLGGKIGLPTTATEVDAGGARMSATGGAAAINAGCGGRGVGEESVRNSITGVCNVLI
jgi:hypothetical protein